MEDGRQYRLSIHAVLGKRHLLWHDWGNVVFEHQPCPKFRIAIPLQRPWLATGYDNQRVANAAWKERIEALAAALRLAKFGSRVQDKRYFEGLPSPSAAAVVAAFLWMSSEWREPGLPGLILAFVITAAAGALMVCRFSYSSFKGFDLTRPVRFIWLVGVALIFIVIGSLGCRGPQSCAQRGRGLPGAICTENRSPSLRPVTPGTQGTGVAQVQHRSEEARGAAF